METPNKKFLISILAGPLGRSASLTAYCSSLANFDP